MRGVSLLSTLAKMRVPDKFPNPAARPNRTVSRQAHAVVCILLSIFLACISSGCARMMTTRYAQLAKDAEAKAAQGDFKRYLTLSPNGPHSNDVKTCMKRDEIALATSLSGDSVVTRTEAARLRNENLNLRKQLEDRSLKPRGTPDHMPSHDSNSEKSATGKSREQTYRVQPGDTLVSISRKFYKSPSRWKEILDANRKKIDDPEKLRAGQNLIIP